MIKEPKKIAELLSEYGCLNFAISTRGVAIEIMIDKYLNYLEKEEIEKSASWHYGKKVLFLQSSL